MNMVQGLGAEHMTLATCINIPQHFCHYIGNGPEVIQIGNNEILTKLGILTL